MYEFVRLNNKDCLSCGQQLPPETRREVTDRNIVIYRCYKCNNEIVRGVVATHCTPVGATSADLPSIVDDDCCLIRNGPDWTTWEIWWSDVARVCAINGRVTCGNIELYDFVLTLQEEHGTKQTA